MKNKRDVLVVEDEVEFLKNFCKLLESEGLTVSSATGGDEALRLAQKYEYSVVIFDLYMLPPTFLDVAEGILLEQKDAVYICVSVHLDNVWFREKMKTIGFEYHEIYKPLTSADYDEIFEICKESIRQETKNSMVRRFFESIELKPGWLGIAIDLKKLFTKSDKG